MRYRGPLLAGSLAALLPLTFAAVPGDAPTVTAAEGLGTAGVLSDPPAVGEVGLPALPDHVDPASWALPEWLTWDDYRPVPGVDWTADEHQPVKKIRAALILGDFEDRGFIASMEEGSELFGIDGVHNPIGVGNVPREEVGDFYADFLIREPSELNHGHTVNEYWLENSYGLVGVDADAFGPYRMDGKEHEYGLDDAGDAASACPTGDDCSKNFDNELVEASLADVTTGMVTNGGRDYDFRWLLHAGYDESGVWEEFGRMQFATEEDVPDSHGSPDPAAPNWAPTRYIDWTSFAAAKGIWSHATPGVMSTQGENDGQATFAHELSHIFGVLDNYNNPFGDPVRRSYSGLWDMLSRGTFNGPGGTHNRWQIPPTQGGAMGSHHMLRNKLRLGFLKPNEVLTLERESLALTGPVVVDLFPRAYPLAPVTDDVGLHGLQVMMAEDRTPSCTVAEDHTCDGGGYTHYTVEVVDAIGYDSFTPDHGVLIAKNKPFDLAPFIWVIDADPSDINDKEGVGRFEGREILDYVAPTGEEFPISLGDARQLVDSTFHAGTAPGVVDEWVDEPNGLHFYVLDTTTREDGVRTYRVAVRSLDGAGPFPRGVEVAAGAPAEASQGRVAEAHFTVTNTGTVVDLVRLSAVDSEGREVRLLHDVVEVPGGGSVDVPVYVAVGHGAPETGELTLTVTSETSGDHAEASVPVRRVTPGANR